MGFVLASATEAKVGALFYNIQDCSMLRTMLSNVHQPCIIKIDNKIAEGIVNDHIKTMKIESNQHADIGLVIVSARATSKSTGGSY